MADTGAPHFIPYVEPTDLVRDYPAADEAQAEAVADALDAIPVLAGIGSNVVQTVKTNTFAHTFTEGGGIAQVDVTGLAVTITPTSDTSKVLVFVTMSGSSSTQQGVADFRVTKNGNTIFAAVGDITGNRFSVSARQSALGQSGFDIAQAHLMFLDSPETTSATTYQVSLVAPVSTTQTSFVNRSNTDSDNFNSRRSISTITAIEVAG